MRVSRRVVSSRPPMMRSQAEAALKAVARRRTAEFFECLPWRAVVFEWTHAGYSHRLTVSYPSVADQIHEYFRFLAAFWLSGVLK